MAMYGELCVEYYDLDKPWPPLSEYAFYTSYLLSVEGPILEPMCGSGRFLLPFLKGGLDVRGFDNSPGMIRALQDKALTLGLTPTVWEADLKDLPAAERYGTLVIPSGSFGLVCDVEDVRHILHAFYRALKTGGLLLLEMETPFAVNEASPQFCGEKRRKDGARIRLSSRMEILPCQSDSPMCRFFNQYDLIQDGLTQEASIVKTEQEVLEIRLYTADVFLQMLGQAGFQKVRAVKAFEKNQRPGPQDSTIVYEAWKV